MKTMKMTITAALVSFLVACGSGASNSPPVSRPPPPPPPPVVLLHEQVEGIWSGESFHPMGASTGFISGVFGAVSATGRDENAWHGDDLVQYEIRFLNDPENDGIFDGSVRAWAPPGTVWPNGEIYRDMDVIGAVIQGATLDLTYFDEQTGASLGSAVFTYNAGLYERTSSLALLSDLWTDDNGNSWQISADGSFFVQNGQGCSYAGNFTAVDSTRNSYYVDADTTGCGHTVSPMCEGISITNDIAIANDQIFVQWTCNGSWRETHFLGEN